MNFPPCIHRKDTSLSLDFDRVPSKDSLPTTVFYKKFLTSF